MVLCVKCKKEDPSRGEDQSGLGEEHFCSECFCRQMYERYRSQVTKSKDHRGQSQRIFLEWDGSFKSELLLHFTTLMWKQEPHRKNTDEFSLLRIGAAELPYELDPRVQVATERESFDRVYSSASINDLSKLFLELTCKGEPEEIPRILQNEGGKIFPLSRMTDGELFRLYSIVFPARNITNHQKQEEGGLAVLVSNFVDKLTEEKPSTPSIVVKTCSKFHPLQQM